MIVSAVATAQDSGVLAGLASCGGHGAGANPPQKTTTTEESKQ